MNIFEKNCKIEDLEAFIKEILKKSHTCRVILLRGNLASGKTTFVQEFAKSIGVDENVTSPTFSVQNVYANKIYHYDIYQNGTDAFIASGLLEELDKDGYHLIEWGDEKLEKILKGYLVDYMSIDIEKNNKNSRNYRVKICIN